MEIKTNPKPTQTPFAKDEVTTTSKISSVKVVDFNPVYSEAKIDELKEQTKICSEEIIRVIMDSRYSAVPYNNDNNAMINLKEAYKNGISIARADVNRIHGKDETKTGDSIMKFGAQHPLLVVTVKMAKAAGMTAVAFDTDSNTEEIKEEDLMLIDGHGRMDYLLGMDDVNKWPNIFGTFPSVDRLGYFNLTKSFEIINTEITKWKTEDLVQKRRLEDGEAAHEGWVFIQNLLKAGYKYQAACVITTLKSDRITSKEAVSGNANDIFKQLNNAKKIYDSILKKLGSSGEIVLKTKEFPMEITKIWSILVEKAGTEYALSTILDFIETKIDKSFVESIASATKSANGLSKLQVRVNILKETFKSYCTINSIIVNID